MGNRPKPAKSDPGGDRKHLTGLEIEKLMEAAKSSQRGTRPLHNPADVLARPARL
jgi:hypothetical protein